MARSKINSRGRIFRNYFNIYTFSFLSEFLVKKTTKKTTKNPSLIFGYNSKVTSNEGKCFPT